jgi:hypothetical protein
MNKVKILIVALFTIVLASCSKNEPILFTDTLVEWDASAYNANGAGVLYPILTRVPGYGRAAITTDPLITRTSGTIKLRVNLVGAQRSTATEMTYQIVPELTTAVSGTHYTTTGKVTIQANTNFGEVEIIILNPGATTTGPKDLVLELIAGAVKPSENEKRIALRIAQS